MKDYKSYTIIAAEPEVVYAALTQPHTIQLWSGAEAIMQEEAGTEFSLWNDDITGTNISFEKNKKIVQHWDFGDQEEASEVTIKLHPHTQGTSLEVRHTNIPDDAFEEIKNGWEDVYLASLQSFYD